MLYAYLITSVYGEFHSGISIDNGSLYSRAVRRRLPFPVTAYREFCFPLYEHFNVCVGTEVPTTVVMNIYLGYNAV
jgi:hypothetical protein